MSAKSSPPDKRIIDVLARHYGIDVVEFALLPVGADLNSSVYKADERDGRSYFIKLKRGLYHDIGVATVELLHDAGIQPVISPVKTMDGQSAQRIGNSTLIVYPFVDGQDGFSRRLTDEQWISLGKTLRQVHDLDVPHSMLLEIRREDYASKWRDVVESLYEQIDAAASFDEFASRLSKYLKDNATTIHQLVDRAEQLARKLQQQTHKFVLCHSDIHAVC